MGKEECITTSEYLEQNIYYLIYVILTIYSLAIWIEGRIMPTYMTSNGFQRVHNDENTFYTNV